MSLFYSSPPAFSTKEKTNCIQVCLFFCSVLHASFENHSRKTPVCPIPSLLLVSPVAQPASRVHPVTLSSSPLDQTIHFTGHMGNGQSSLLLVCWGGDKIVLPLSPIRNSPLVVSPPAVFWVRGQYSPSVALISTEALWGTVSIWNSSGF